MVQSLRQRVLKTATHLVNNLIHYSETVTSSSRLPSQETHPPASNQSSPLRILYVLMRLTLIISNSKQYVAQSSQYFPKGQSVFSINHTGDPLFYSLGDKSRKVKQNCTRYLYCGFINCNYRLLYSYMLISLQYYLIPQFF